MSRAAALIAQAGAAGCRLEVRERDARRFVWASRPDLLPLGLRDQLRAHRAEVLLLLDRANDDERSVTLPPLPEPGTPERQRHDAAQERALRGLMLASRAHVCRVCGALACFGFGPPGKPVAWYCLAHRAEGERHVR